MSNLDKNVPQKAHSWFGIDIGSGKDESVVMNINRAQYFSDKAKDLLENKNLEQRIYEQVNSIMMLAMVSSDVLHIHVHYSAHIKQVDVRVNPFFTNYKFPTAIYKENVYIDKPQSLTELKDIEDLLIDLVAEARSKVDRA